MDNRSKAELELITVLEQTPEVSQTGLARRLNIAAGLVNLLMKRAVKKGFIKMTQIPARRYGYYLTPEGFMEKSKLVASYLNSSLDLFRRLRVDYRDIFQRLEAEGVKEVVLIGDIDIAEIAIMAAQDSTIGIKALINKTSNKNQIGTIPIKTSLGETSLAEYDGAVFIICDSLDPQACFDHLSRSYPKNSILWPESFYISPPQNN